MAGAVAVLAALPALGLDAVLISIPLLGPEVAGARVVGAVVLALGAAVGVGRWAGARGADGGRGADGRREGEEAAVAFAERLRAGLRFGLVERVDHTLPWVGAGLMLAALVEPLLGAQAFAGVPAGVQVPVAALVGLPFYICAAGVTPLVAVALHKGLSAGAALAFVLAGPVVGVTALGGVARQHGRRAAVGFAVVVLGGAMGIGWGFDALVQGGGVAVGFDLHAEAAAGGSALRWVCLGAIAALGLASLWRQGARGVVEQIVHPIRGV